MRKLTTEEFIEKAKIKHGDKYDYSLVDYQGAGIKVIINCKAHGDFLQLPSNHTSGQGCPQCGGVGKITTEIFIDRCNKIHGGKYDYSSVDYSSGRRRVKIKCKEHGFFYQIAESHMSGKGCKKCGGSERLTKKLFIERSERLHRGSYDYSLVEYKNLKSKVKIICQKHGVFIQAAGNHLIGGGCLKCSGNKRLTSYEFIEDSVIIHGKKYDYSMVNYVNAAVKVKISCPKHGVFMQTPANHKKGAGCPYCAVHGFKGNENACVYVLRSECGSYLKVGISNNVEERLLKLKRDTPFNFNVIEKFHAIGLIIRDMESKFHKIFDNAGFKGFDGATEWFHYDNEKLEQLKNYGESINEN